MPYIMQRVSCVSEYVAFMYAVVSERRRFLICHIHSTVSGVCARCRVGAAPAGTAQAVGGAVATHPHTPYRCSTRI